jgi:hypothetical protein
LEQHRLTAVLRACGMHVSNWYLPAHWFAGTGGAGLPGVERLSREVFQFWLDQATTHESIVQQAEAVRHAMTSVHVPRTGELRCDR